MTVRDYAEKILLANTLEEKLAPPPPGLSLDPPNKLSYRTPDLPGRPQILLPRRPSETRTKLPSAEQLASEEHRSVLLHFFCNHELIAVELMALALLKFPDAPDAFRRGLLHTLQDEQEHTRLYMSRMAATGMTFGEHSLSRMIWDHISTMTSPIEYVSRLSLTFEQSNLDFAKHYSGAFARAGDEESSALLARIYKDEIAHVGYGLKWLRRFKDQKESDWDAWHNSLARPLTPIRAKAPEGSVPFNEEGRRMAGLNDDFIRNLELYNRSRGRTPNVHYFNPNCELHALAADKGTPFQGSKNDLHLEQDLEALILANAHVDDLAVLRTLPSDEHLARLKAAGLPLPEVVADLSELHTRKLGGFRPWAWSPETAELFRPFADNPTPKTLFPWSRGWPSSFFSKELTSSCAQALALEGNLSLVATTCEEAFDAIREIAHERVLLKSPFSCAGRGQFAIDNRTSLEEITNWLTKTLATQPSIIIEPHLPRILDFSALYDVTRSGEVNFLAITRMETNSGGQYLGTTVAPKVGNLLPPELAVAFHQPCITVGGVAHPAPYFYKTLLPAALLEVLPGYHGPIAVDSFFYQDPDGRPRIRPVVEINARCSMGRIAHNLRKKLTPNGTGTLRIHHRKKLAGQLPDGLLLNDPATAQSFLATWSEGA